MDDSGKKLMKECLKWILMVSMSPIAFLIFMHMALYGLLRFLCKAALLFIIVAINTPFAVMYNVSNIVFRYNFARLQESPCVHGYSNWSNGGRGNVKTSDGDWNWSDPRADVGIEVKPFVSDFLKVVAGELLLLLSTGIITYYTAPRKVFYISTVVWVVAIFHKWLNSPCLSKTGLSILCDLYGLSPMTFLYSYVGLFDIGCHPIAKCSFIAERAFLFVKDAPSQLNKEHVDHQFSSIRSLCQIDYKSIVDPIVNEIRAFQLGHKRDSNHQIIGELFTEKEYIGRTPPECGAARFERPPPPPPCPPPNFHYIDSERVTEQNYIGVMDIKTTCARFERRPPSKFPDKDSEKGDVDPYAEVGKPIRFNRTENGTKKVIEFSKWNAFERGLFELSPRIKFFKRDKGKCTLETFMVLKLREGQDLWKGQDLCEYPVERLELPEDYSNCKVNELYNFLVTLSKADGFVTNKMEGRYEHSLTLWEIVKGVQEHDEYEVMAPMDHFFVVA